MATTTPNYGWAVPTSTDLVKDGATAIETLGDAIDASMFTALGTKKAGMVLLNTTTISGAPSTVSVNDVFSATYDNYLILINSAATSLNSDTLRLRVSGTDNSSNDYRHYFSDSASSGSTWTTAASSSTSAFRIGTSRNGHNQSIAIQIFSPFSSLKTQIKGDGINFDGTNAGILPVWGSMSVTTSYTGFTYIGGTGLTGSIRVYGYQN
jgi:hypothetical protein